MALPMFSKKVMIVSIVCKPGTTIVVVEEGGPLVVGVTVDDVSVENQLG